MSGERERQRQSTTEARGIQSVEVSVKILEAFLEAPEPLMLREIAEISGYTAAQVHAYMVSFKRMGLVEQDRKSGRYGIGAAALDLAAARLRSFDPMHAASQAVEALCNETGVTVALTVWGSFGPTVVMVQNGVDTLYIDTRVGTVYSITGTATGLVFAAFLPSEIIRDAYRSEAREAGKTMRVGSLRPLSAIKDEIAIVRRRGYSTIATPPIPGTTVVSAPVFDYAGQLQMAITVIGNARTQDFSDGSPDVARLMAAARRLSFEHGYVAQD
jgi:DNA-binding IclR family transcriptional regulator